MVTGERRKEVLELEQLRPKAEDGREGRDWGVTGRAEGGGRRRRQVASKPEAGEGLLPEPVRSSLWTSAPGTSGS